MNQVPAGWYMDPENSGQSRYWDGTAWTSSVAPANGYTEVNEFSQQPRDSATQLASGAEVLPVAPYAGFEGRADDLEILDRHTASQEPHEWGSIETEATVSGPAGCLFGISLWVATFASHQLAVLALISGVFDVGFPLLRTALMFAVLFSFFHAVLVMPLYIAITTAETNRTILQNSFSLGYGDQEYMYRLPIAANKAYRNWRIAWLIISAIVAFLLHDPLMSLLGNPWADVLTISILVIGFQLVGVLAGQSIRMWILSNGLRVMN